MSTSAGADPASKPAVMAAATALGRALGSARPPAPASSFSLAEAAPSRTSGDECSRHFAISAMMAGRKGAMSEGDLMRAQLVSGGLGRKVSVRVRGQGWGWG